MRGKLFLLLVILLISSGVLAQDESPNPANGGIGERIGNIGDRVESGNERLSNFMELSGQKILEVQEVIQGGLTFITFGLAGKQEKINFQQFLFLSLAFLLLYSLISFIPRVNNFFAFIISLSISFFLLLKTPDLITKIITEGTGLVTGTIISLILPVGILLIFSIRSYYKAYFSKERTGPFAVAMFNLVLFVLFGVFFIQYGLKTEDTLAKMRIILGIALIVWGVMQIFLSKYIVRLLRKAKKLDQKAQEDLYNISQEARKEFLRRKLEMQNKVDGIG